MQHAAASNVPNPNKSLSGVGTTYMLFPDPPRIGEKGPSSTEHISPQVVLPYGKVRRVQKVALGQLLAATR